MHTDELSGDVELPRFRRERVLFTETPERLPVDFHSWRRAYSQALADADVNAQQASRLAGHDSLSAHQRYLQNAEKMARLPEPRRVNAVHDGKGHPFSWMLRRVASRAARGDQSSLKRSSSAETKAGSLSR